MAENDKNSLIFKIDYLKNVELDDLIVSLSGLSNQYSKFLELDKNNPYNQELKLYIREIKKGSIISDLFVATAATGSMVFLENIVTIVEFIKYLNCAYSYYLGKGDKQREYTKQEMKNFRNIVEPVAKDNGSQLIIQNCNNVVIKLDSEQANAIQNRIKREEDQVNVKSFNFVTFTLFKTRVPQDLTTGFSGIIQSILENKALPTIFQDSTTRDEIISIPENPLLKQFKVDAIVYYENETPVKYQITRVYKLD